MFLTLINKKTVAAILLIALSVTGFMSCQKELSSTGTEPINNPGTPPDLSTKINSSVSGFVNDENEVAVEGAVVVYGNTSTTTDKFGYFEVRNQQVVQQAAIVSIIKPGYFKAVKTYIATAGKSAFFRIKLLPKTEAGTIDAVAGGKVAMPNGLSVTLPAGAVVNATIGNAYTGTVSVAAQWLNPTASDLDRIMPGDLRGINTDGVLKLLQTYGMSAIELTGSSGEPLQIATGKKAIVNFPLPASVSGTAPNNIPLWHFDEEKGLWKEEGIAVKSGNIYVGEVSHFSYWNCDYPIEQSVEFTCTVVDADGDPLPNISVWVEYANGGWIGSHGWTDSTGFITGVMPANANLIVKLYTDYQCIGPVLTQNVTTANVNISLGNIVVPSNSSATLAGNAIDCNNNPVANGYILLKQDSYYSKTAINADGTFEISTLFCASNTSATIIAVDNASLQQSTSISIILKGGQNILEKIVACGNTIEEYINNTVDGNAIALTPPSDYVAQGSDSMGVSNLVYIIGGNNSGQIGFTFSSVGITVGSSQALSSYSSTQTGDTKVGQQGSPVINVTITEYGAIGQFIAGNFSGTVKDYQNNDHTISCSFRVRRVQ